MFVGTTGFGKTYLAAHALNERKYVVVHDGKGTFKEKDWITDDWDVVRTVDEARKSKKKRICYSPTRDERRDPEINEQFFEWILRRGHTTLLIDEMTLVCGKQTMPLALQDLYATGRETGAEVWACTQQPVDLPNLAFTQSRGFYIFYCALGTHRDKIASFVPIDPDLIRELDAKEYFTYQDTWRQADGPFILGDEEEEAPATS